MPSPEELAREQIDKILADCGWIIQSRNTINLSAGRGVAIREALLKDRDEVDYLLFVDGKAIGTVEAKPEGYTLTGVEEQSGKYGKGLLDIQNKALPTGAIATRSRTEPPGFRVPLGNSNLADMATPFDINGTGTIIKKLSQEGGDWLGRFPSHDRVRGA